MTKVLAAVLGLLRKVPADLVLQLVRAISSAPDPVEATKRAIAAEAAKRVIREALR